MESRLMRITTDRNTSLFDKVILRCDALLRAKHNKLNTFSVQPNPAAAVETDHVLSLAERKKTVAMMRVNHTGEVCAQALYLGQALVAHSDQQYTNLIHAAAEENDHLIWCKARLTDLNGRTSLLNPLWFAGSYGIGVLAGLGGDKISLGFIAETEHQVAAHLDKNLKNLSVNDDKTRAILQQMRTDELEHANFAKQSGARELPWVCKIAMRCVAKVMTVTAAKI